MTLSVLVAALSCSAAWAAWTATGTGGSVARSTVLHPPTALSVTQVCVADPTPQWRSTSGPSTRSGSSLTIPAPAGVMQDDVLVAAVSWSANGPIPTPTGWAKTREDGKTPITQAVFVRVATASEPASYTWTHTGDPAVGGINAYSGADTAAPVVNSSGQYIERDRAVTAPELTTTRGNARLIAVFGIAEHATLTTDEPMTTRWSQRSGSGVTYVSTLIADQSWPTPGPTGTRNATATGGNKGVGQLLVLRPRALPWATTTWTVSSSAFATGQTYRRRSGGTTQVESPLGVGVTSRSDGPLVSGTGYTIDVTTSANNWRATASTGAFSAVAC